MIFFEKGEMITLNDSVHEYLCILDGDQHGIEKVLQKEILVFVEKLVHGKWLSRALHRGKIVLIDPRAFISQNSTNNNT